MLIAPCARTALISFLLLLPQLATTQLVVEQKSESEKRIKCIISTASEKWHENSDTLVQIRLKNLTDVAVDAEFNATMYLTPDSRLTPVRRYGASGSVPFWSPIDLAHDAPAPTDTKLSGGLVSIKLRMQQLRIEGNGEQEFTVHASNMKWQRTISSVWPNLELLKSVPADTYSLQLAVDTTAGSTDSNAVKVVITKQ